MKLKIIAEIDAGEKTCVNEAGRPCHMCIDMAPGLRYSAFVCLAYRARNKQNVSLRENRKGEPVRCRACLKGEVKG